MATTLEILASIRADASSEYAARVPEAVATNLTDVATALLNYAPAMNEFLTTVLNKLALTTIESKLMKNPLAGFKQGKISFGTDIEEMFVAMAKDEGYTMAGENPFNTTDPEVSVIYHRLNRESRYPGTIREDQFRRAFTSQNSMSGMVQAIINSLYAGAEYDEYVHFKNLIAEYALNFYDYPVPAITDEATTRTFLRTVRKACLDMTFMSKTFNKKGVMTYTPVTEQALIVNKDVLSHTDVDVLAKTFNIGKTDFQPTIIPVDDFGTMTTTYGILVDKGLFKIFDRTQQLTSLYNPKGMYTNYWLQVKQILSMSTFKNAIRFPIGTPAG